MDISYLFAVKENEQMDKIEDKSLRQGQKARNQDKTEDKSLRQSQKARNQDKTEEKTLNKVRKTSSRNWAGCLSGWSIVPRCLGRVSQWVEHSIQVPGPGVSVLTEFAVLTEFTVHIRQSTADSPQPTVHSRQSTAGSLKSTADSPQPTEVCWQFSVRGAEYPAARVGGVETFVLGILLGLVHKGLQPEFDGGIFLSVIGNAHIGDVPLVLSQLV